MPLYKIHVQNYLCVNEKEEVHEKANLKSSLVNQSVIVNKTFSMYTCNHG